MSNRLDQERETRLQPQRMASCKDRLEQLGFVISYQDYNRLEFMFEGNKITFYPYSGWHSGKGIKDGRGFENLLGQIANEADV